MLTLRSPWGYSSSILHNARTSIRRLFANCGLKTSPKPGRPIIVDRTQPETWFTSLKKFCSSCISGLKSWFKPLLAAAPISWLFAYSKNREANLSQNIERKAEDYKFIRAKTSGPKPLIIVALGTMQDFDSPSAGLMQVVEHARKNHDAHILVLKAPDASKAVSHLFCYSNDASFNTEARTKLNSELVRDIVKSQGDFADIKVSGTILTGFSWGAGMLSSMRKQKLFDDLKIPILGTATVDAIKPGLENMGEGLKEIGSGDEPNLHIYQDETYYGLNGECIRDAAYGDEVYKCSAEHEKLDNDPWAINKVSQFLDKLILDSKNSTTKEKALAL